MQAPSRGIRLACAMALVGFGVGFASDANAAGLERKCAFGDPLPQRAQINGVEPFTARLRTVHADDKILLALFDRADRGDPESIAYVGFQLAADRTVRDYWHAHDVLLWIAPRLTGMASLRAACLAGGIHHYLTVTGQLIRPSQPDARPKTVRQTPYLGS